MSSANASGNLRRIPSCISLEIFVGIDPEVSSKIPSGVSLGILLENPARILSRMPIRISSGIPARILKHSLPGFFQ